MNKLKHIILKQWANTILSKWEKDCQKPQKIYDANFKFIQKHSKQKQIKALNNFKNIRKLPLKDYNDYKEIFNNSLEDKINPLNGEQIHFWATSTGSTDVPKIFPISPIVDKSSKMFQKTRASLMIKHLNIWTSKPELIFVLPGEKQEFNPNLPIGQIGYYFQKQAPKWLKKQFIFSKALYKNKAIFDKWHIVAALLSDCSGITTSIPARLTYFINYIKANQKELKTSIENETFPKEYFNKLSKKRIKYIVNVLDNPINSIKDIWPSLNFVCAWHAGDSCNKQLKELKRCIDFKNVKFIDQIYNSSEDIFNIPLIEEVGGPLNIYNHIVEFYDSKTNTFFWPWEIKENEIYEIVITNTMGLTRYRMYDNIICTGFYKNTPKIAFHSRNIPEISLGWCTISEKQLSMAINNLNQGINSPYYFSVNKKGNGLTIISYKNDIELQLENLNKNLKIQNPNYKKQLVLGNVIPIKFVKITENEFYQLMLNNANSKRLLLK